jgi:hypothetical protein
MAFLIGDKVRLGAIVKNLAGIEEAPAAITVSVYRQDAETKLLDQQAATLKTGTTAEYYHDWTISGTLTAPESLIVLWEWSGPHKKRTLLEVEPAV